MKIFIITLLSANFAANLATAAEVSCPNPVDHVVVEQGHSNPPNIIAPEVSHGSISHGVLSDSRFEWIFSSSSAKKKKKGKKSVAPAAAAPQLVAHCYVAKDESQKEDVAIPAGKNKCVLTKKKFVCP